MIYKHISIITFLFSSFLFNQDNAEYIILTISEYQNAANVISNIHSKEVEIQNRLNTKIIFLDTFEWYNANDDSLAYFIRNEVQQLTEITKYLLLLGDESIIPPIYISSTDGSLQPSDDFYSCNDNVTTFAKLQDSKPQISTGRIPVNNAKDATVIADKLYQYMVNPSTGFWRSKIGLIADDENKDGYSQNELNHTINSNKIYESISNNLNVSQFYGLNYETIQNSSYIAKPQMTADVIDYINKGAALINYIGHGSESTLGGEKILDMSRDLNHICSLGTICKEQKKTAIWIVGTCSFGKYDNSEQIMSEKLLFSDSGAISLVTTSRGIGAYANSFYLTNFFLNINDFVLDNNNYRLGDIVRQSKQTGRNTEYLFHLLGDPALILPFPKVIAGEALIDSNILLDSGFEIMSNVTDVLYQAGLNHTNYEDVNITVTSNEVNFEDSFPDTTISYILNGNQMHSGTISENSCINIPLDIENCNDCSNVKLTLFSDKLNSSSMYNGSIQIIENIPIKSNSGFQNDNIGPLIHLYQKGNLINNGSIINAKIPVKIILEDELGINFMNGLQHNVRYWFNNENYTYEISPNLFEYEPGSCGKASANFFIPSHLKSGDNVINIEAWDNGNNKTLSKYNFNLESDEHSYVSQLYNFPNPFRDNTFFTFYLSKYPAEVEITIYTINGNPIKTIKTYCDEYYNVLKWDGKTQSGKEIQAGPYMYLFKSNAFIDGTNYQYKTINKIAKIK